MQFSVLEVIALALIAARLLAELRLGWLNRRHVRAHAGAVPEPFKDVMDCPTYAKSIEYTLAKSRFASVEDTFGAVVLAVLFLSGVLPWAYMSFTGKFGASIWALASFLFGVGVVLSLLHLPFDWHAQFKLEARFGFNTMTWRTWWADRVKGILLALVLGYPLLALVLQCVAWAGQWWWLWAWAAVMLFQMLMVLLAPLIILPLFNKFTPLPEGTLRERLLRLAHRARFGVRGIQVMDGSKRSRHSNAFFTGFGRLRKIVLFDTLMQQLVEPELEAVLAHEIGHYKKRHIPKMLMLSAASMPDGNPNPR